MIDRSPAISVVIPAHNACSTIRPTVSSVLGQTYREFELIVVDDGSTDDTAGVVESFGDDRIVCLHVEHRERAVARNKGIAAAKGKYIAFLDADDLWLPRKLEKQLAVLEANPEIGLVYGDLYYFDDATGQDVTFFGKTRSLHRGEIALHLLLKANFIQSPTVVVPKSVFHQVGLFDPGLVPIEDWDMWLRIAAGYPIDYVPEPLARYRLHQGFTSTANPTLSLFESTCRLLDKAERAYGPRSWKVRRMIRLKRALAHYGYGVKLMENGAFRDARARFISAIRAYWPYPFSYLRYVQSLRHESSSQSGRTSKHITQRNSFPGSSNSLNQ